MKRWILRFAFSSVALAAPLALAQVPAAQPGTTNLPTATGTTANQPGAFVVPGPGQLAPALPGTPAQPGSSVTTPLATPGAGTLGTPGQIGTLPPSPTTPGTLGGGSSNQYSTGLSTPGSTTLSQPETTTLSQPGTTSLGQPGTLGAPNGTSTGVGANGQAASPTVPSAVGANPNTLPSSGLPGAGSTPQSTVPLGNPTTPR